MTQFANSSGAANWVYTSSDFGAIGKSALPLRLQIESARVRRVVSMHGDLLKKEPTNMEFRANSLAQKTPQVANRAHWTGLPGALAMRSFLPVCLVATAMTASAQTNSVTLVGAITDKSGGVLAAATVTAVNRATGTAKTATSDQN